MTGSLPSWLIRGEALPLACVLPPGTDVLFVKTVFGTAAMSAPQFAVGKTDAGAPAREDLHAPTKFAGKTIFFTGNSDTDTTLDAPESQHFLSLKISATTQH